MEHPFNLKKIKEYRSFKTNLPKVQRLSAPENKTEGEKIREYKQQLKRIVGVLLNDYDTELDNTYNKLSEKIDNFIKKEFTDIFTTSLEGLFAQMFLLDKREYQEDELYNFVFTHYFEFVSALLKAVRYKDPENKGLKLSRSDALAVARRSINFNPSLYTKFLSDEDLLISRSNIMYLLNKTGKLSEQQFTSFIYELNEKARYVINYFKTNKIKISKNDVLERVTRNDKKTKEEIIEILLGKTNLVDEIIIENPGIQNFFSKSFLREVVMGRFYLSKEGILSDLKSMEDAVSSLSKEFPYLPLSIIKASIGHKVKRDPNGKLIFDIEALKAFLKEREAIARNLRIHFHGTIPNHYITYNALRYHGNEDQMRNSIESKKLLVEKIYNKYKNFPFISKSAIEEYIYNRSQFNESKILKRFDHAICLAQEVFQKFGIEKPRFQIIVFSKLLVLPGIAPQDIIDRYLASFLKFNAKEFEYNQDWSLHNKSVPKELTLSDVRNALVEAGAPVQTLDEVEQILIQINDNTATDDVYLRLATIFRSFPESFKILETYISMNKDLDSPEEEIIFT